MTAELEAAANGEIGLLGRDEVGADIIAEIDDWLQLGFRLMRCGCLANKYGEAAHGPEDEHEVDEPMGEANSLDPLRELAEWLTIECHLLEPVAEPQPNPVLDEFRWALLAPEPAGSASPLSALAHAIRRAVDDARLLALALGIVTAGPGEFASAWIEALARLADESGDEFRSAGPPHALAEARNYVRDHRAARPRRRGCRRRRPRMPRAPPVAFACMRSARGDTRHCTAYEIRERLDQSVNSCCCSPERTALGRSRERFRRGCRRPPAPAGCRSTELGR